MAAPIVSREIFDLASEIETESSKLESFVELMNKALQFRYVDKDEVASAQGQLFLLSDVLSEIQKRIEAISSAAYDLSREAKATA
jgi:hypothetical protein